MPWCLQGSSAGLYHFPSLSFLHLVQVRLPAAGAQVGVLLKLWVLLVSAWPSILWQKVLAVENMCGHTPSCPGHKAGPPLEKG